MAPYDGSGQFDRAHDFEADRYAGVNILAARVDAEFDGMATGLSTCITNDGQTTITANIPMSSLKFTALAAGTSDGDSAL